MVGGLGEAVAGLLLRSGVTPVFPTGRACPMSSSTPARCPTLHERYGISTNAMSRQIKRWLSH